MLGKPSHMKLGNLRNSSSVVVSGLHSKGQCVGSGRWTPSLWGQHLVGGGLPL